MGLSVQSLEVGESVLGDHSVIILVSCFTYLHENNGFYLNVLERFCEIGFPVDFFPADRFPVELHYWSGESMFAFQDIRDGSDRTSVQEATGIH